LSKLIITCAITDSRIEKKDTAFIPITPKEIAESSIAAVKMGASVIHTRVRDPGTKTGTLDGGLSERALSIFLGPPNFLELRANNAEESEVRLELESLHAGMLHRDLLWAWQRCFVKHLHGLLWA
jgi:uncharacterized protein (DUF849 family)